MIIKSFSVPNDVRKKNNYSSLWLLALFGIFALGFSVPAYAMTINFDHTSPDNWYFIGHGAVVTLDGSNDSFYTDTNSGVQTVDTTFTPSGGGQPITLTFIETSATSGKFTFPNYIMFTSTSNANVPSVSVVDGGTVTASASPHNGPISSTVSIVGTDPWGSITPNPNQANKRTKLACGINGDLDTDGICDSWETSNGLRISGVGSDVYTYPCSRLLDYPAHPIIDDVNNPVTCPLSSKKDIYVEIDYMKWHAPDANGLLNVIKAFHNHNINLHLQVNEEIPYHKNIISGPGAGGAGGTEFDTIKDAYFGTAADRNSANILTEKRQVFHYALFAHSSTSGGSGVSELPGNDIAVYLGNWAGGVGSADQQSGTFMHELGHNLYLYHGGTSDNTNCKPNYLSVMNYAFQFSNYVSNRPLDYSSGGSSQLNEGTDNENNGIGTAYAGKQTVWGPSPVMIGTVGQWLDFNKDSQPETSVSGDWNNFGASAGCDGSQTSLPYSDSNDWAGLKLDVKANTGFSDGAPISASDIHTINTILSNPTTKQLFYSTQSTPSIIQVGYVSPLHKVDYKKDIQTITCNCDNGMYDLNDPKRILQYNKTILSYLDPAVSVSYGSELTKANSTEQSRSVIHSIDYVIQNLPTCTFTENNQNPLTCSGDDYASKQNLRAELQQVDDLVKNDELYGATLALQAASADAEKSIYNPIARAQVVGMMDNSIKSLQLSSAATQPDYIPLSSSIPDWIYWVIVGLIIVIIVIVIVWIITRPKEGSTGGAARRGGSVEDSKSVSQSSM